MSGAVNTVKDVVKATSLPIVAPYKAAAELVTKGKNPLRSIGEQAKSAAGSAMKAATPALEGLGLVNDEPLPSIADPVDPNKVAEDGKREKARARRQAEIDLLTNKPGRGGTILTDQYTYKV